MLALAMFFVLSRPREHLIFEYWRVFVLFRCAV